MAAMAQVVDLALVTHNVKDVAWTGVSCQNPFERVSPQQAAVFLGRR